MTDLLSFTATRWGSSLTWPATVEVDKTQVKWLSYFTTLTGSSPPADLVWSVNGEKVAAMEVHQESFSHFQESRGHSAVRQMVRSLTCHMCKTLVHLFLGLTRCLWEYKGMLLLYLYGLYFSIFLFSPKIPPDLAWEDWALPPGHGRLQPAVDCEGAPHGAGGQAEVHGCHRDGELTGIANINFYLQGKSTGTWQRRPLRSITGEWGRVGH